MVDLIGPVVLAAAAHARGLTREELQAWLDVHQAEPLPTTSLEAYDVLRTMQPQTPLVPPIMQDPQPTDNEETTNDAA